MSNYDSKKLVYRVEYFFFNRIIPSLRNFPKSEKHHLVKRIEDNFLELSSKLILAESVKVKRIKMDHLNNSEGILATIMFLFRYVRVKKYQGKGFLDDIDEELNSMLKQLRNWIKAL